MSTTSAITSPPTADGRIAPVRATTAGPIERRRVLRLGAAAIAAGTSALLVAEIPTFAADAAFDTQVASLIVTGINAQRTRNGLATLTRDGEIDRVAVAWSARMAAANSLDHNPSYASQMPAGWTRAGENIAASPEGGSAQAVADQFVAQWMGSAGHRANILTAAFNRTGVGVKSTGREIYATQDFGAY